MSIELLLFSYQSWSLGPYLLLIGWWAFIRGSWLKTSNFRFTLFLTGCDLKFWRILFASVCSLSTKKSTIQSMSSVLLGVRMSSFDFQRIKMENVDFSSKIHDFKNEVSKKANIARESLGKILFSLNCLRFACLVGIRMLSRPNPYLLISILLVILRAGLLW